MAHDSPNFDLTALTHLTIEKVADAIYWARPDGRILYANEAACLATGYTKEELSRLYVIDLAPNLSPELWEEHSAKVKSQGSFRFETIHRRKNGSIFPVEITDNHFKLNGQEYHCAFIHDISKRKQNEKEHRLMQEAVERSKTYFYRLSSTGEVLYANAQACDSIGYSKEEILHKTIWDFDPDFPREAWEPMWQELRKNGNVHVETRHRRKDGTIFPIEVVGDYINNGEEEYCFCFAQDITEKKETEARIQHLAYYDVLTELPNRALLLDRMEVLLASSQREGTEFSVLFMDLDRFKYINDSLGHFAGDRLLQEAAVRIKHCIRGADTVARIGGDEFVVLLPNTNAEGAVIVATHILEALAVEIEIEDKPVHTQASIGISCFPKDSSDAQQLIKYADIAMYKAKEEGRNNYQFFTPELDRLSSALFSLDLELRQALENDELFLHYQPQINLQSGTLCGAEALLRWKHPTRGMVSPAEFIPVAEETGLIVSIGKWVIKMACQQLASWRAKTSHLFPIAVNISARQLKDPSLAAFVEQQIKQNGLQPHDLELEITEGSMLTNAQSTMSFLQQMHALGVQLAIDDFGTGYSSLNYLKRLPVNKLKIDQSFVRDIATDENDDAIVRSIIGLAHQFKLKVIAEGLETETQLEFLKENGCDKVQGFYISRPLPEDKFFDLISGTTQYLA